MLRRKKLRASAIGSSSGASSETVPSTWARALPTMTKAGGSGTPWRTEIAVSWLSRSTRLISCSGRPRISVTTAAMSSR